MEVFGGTTTLSEAVDYSCWLCIDFVLMLELQAISCTLVLTEWSRTLLWGPQWEHVLEAVLTLSQWGYCWCFIATIGSFLVAACFVHRCRTRLSLRRKHTLQLKKRWSTNLRKARFTYKLRSNGLFFLVLVHCSYGVQTMEGQQMQQFLTGIGALLTKQDQVLQNVVENLGTGSTSAAASVAKSLESAARILKTPEHFDASDTMSWVTWRHSFLNWLSYADSRFLDNIIQVEKLSPSDSVETVDWDEAEWDLARKLYAVLTSYLKGTALQLSRSGSEERNGYALWKTLMDHFASATRQRALALSQAIASYPQFKPAAGKTLQEHIMAMEALVQQYDSLHSKPFDREVLLGVLMRLCPEGIRQHLTLSISDTTSYQEVRERILAYERSSRLWSVEDIVKSTTKQTDNMGLAPMEVDQVSKGKGKGKGKGKSKSKGKGNWSDAWSWTSSWFKGGGKQKGKTRDKGKGKSKGKSKGKNKGKGKQKGKLNPDRCRVCGGFGHWGNECPNKQDGVREVRESGQQQQTVPLETRVPSSSSTTYSSVGSTAASTQRSVRRVQMYHVGTPPLQVPEQFNISEVGSEEEEDWSTLTILQGKVRTVKACGDDCWSGDQETGSMCEQYNIFDAEDLSCGVEWPADDAFYWWLSSDQETSFEREATKQEQEKMFVRVVENVEESEWIVLDSGADVSLLPYRCLAGQDIPSPNLQLEDAQGNSLAVGGMKQAQVEFEHCLDDNFGCCISESFVVSNVTNILLSFGRMLKTGWTFGEQLSGDTEMVNRLGFSSCAGILTSPDGRFRIPVFFRKNSLSVLAHVRRATESDVEQPNRGHVRGAYVRMSFDVDSLKEGWSFLENGNPVNKRHGRAFVNPGEALSRVTWRFRTTIALVGPVWEVIEHSQELALLDDLEGDIPGLVLPTTILTFPQRYISPLSDCLCTLVADEQLPEVMDELEKREDEQRGVHLFASEPQVPQELQDVPMLEAKGTAGGHEEQLESVWVNGRELTKDSRVKDLQDGCNFLGINASGSKSKLYDRLCSYVTKQFQKDVDRSRTNLQKLELGPEPVAQKKGMEKPTDPRAIERHEATHLPFAPWCDACLKTKSKEDHTLSNTDEAVESSGIPHIQMDWMYLGRNCPSLVLLDTMTRFGAIFPARTKGAWRALAEFCVKFSLGLNHLGEVVYVMDSEPATLGLLDMIVMIRQDMGYKTSKKVGKPYHKGRTARVERYIQTIRKQSSTLMTSVEDNIHELLDDLHCLRAWALVHSVFLLNRFHEHSAIKATAFETVFGHKYQGKILPFGEFVFGLRQPLKKKGTSVWQGGIWIGKDEADMHVLVTAGGQFHTRSIRRCSHAWRPDVIKSLTSSPWTKTKSSGPVGLLEAPLPAIEEKPERERQQGSYSLGIWSH